MTSSTRYNSVPQDEEHGKDDESRHPEYSTWTSCQKVYSYANGGLFLIIILLLYSTYVTWRLQQYSGPHASYETGFPTELSTATSIISLRKQRFTGDLHFHENGSSYLTTEPGHLQYVGNPSPEIDKNWHDIINDRYFYLSESEAKQAWSDNFDGYFDVIEGERWYVGGLDILHTLHCLNTLRMHLDQEYYYSGHMSRRPSQNHNYHCIDQIRQYLMCYGDLTPVPTRWHDGKGRIYVQSDMNHTCRNFDGVVEWVRGRKIVY